jgi:hypothetical protein
LQAFLTNNCAFEVRLALNWLARHHTKELEEALPTIDGLKIYSSANEQEQPGPTSFWIQRK